MSISISRLGFLCLGAMADADPVWSSAVGIHDHDRIFGDPDGPRRAASALVRLRKDVATSRGGDQTERALLLGVIDLYVAQSELDLRRRDPCFWLDHIAAGIEAVEGDAAACEARLLDIPRFLAAAIPDGARAPGIIARLYAERAADLAEWLHASGAPEAAIAVIDSTRRIEQEDPPRGIGAEHYQRLFRLMHRMHWPADEIIDGASRSLSSPAEPRSSNLDRAAGPILNLAVRVAHPARPAWLPRYRPPACLDLDPSGVMYVADRMDEATIPAAHMLYSAAARLKGDLRRVVVAPATTRGLDGLVAAAEGSPDHPRNAALALLDAGLHHGSWSWEDALDRVSALSGRSRSWGEQLAIEAWRDPALASSAFVGTLELLDRWDASGQGLNAFVSDLIAEGPLPLPLITVARSDGRSRG